MTTKLNESKIFNFLDEENNFSLRFLEGQKVIHDLALIHGIQNKGFFCFRDLTLSSLHLMSYLKHGESLGVFVDSDTPPLRYKIEMHESGTFRNLLLPETMEENPNSLSGTVRVVKMFPNNPHPYSSYIELNKHSPRQVTNSLLEESYQINATIIVSENSDQSLLITKLPKPTKVMQGKSPSDNHDMSLEQYLKEQQPALENILDLALNEDADIMNQFQKLELTFLHGKETKHHCPCSQEQMESSIANLCLSEGIDDVFESDQTLEARCDYCKTYYYVEKEAVKKATIKN